MWGMAGNVIIIVVLLAAIIWKKWNGVAWGACDKCDTEMESPKLHKCEEIGMTLCGECLKTVKA